MRSYLIHSNGKGRIVDVPGEYTSDDYGNLQEAFASEARGKQEPASIYEKYADMVHLDPYNTTPNGVSYDWGLAGPDGAWFTLIQMPGVTEAEIKTAKAYLRSSQDVVRLYVLKINQLI